MKFSKPVIISLSVLLSVLLLGALAFYSFQYRQNKPLVNVSNVQLVNENSKLLNENTYRYSSINKKTVCLEFDFDFNGSERFDLRQLSSRVAEEIPNADLPVQFIDELQAQEQAGWALNELCVDASSVKISTPEIYLAMLYDPSKPAVATQFKVPAGTTRGAANKIGYWKAMDDGTYKPIAFSSAILANGMGDVTFFRDLTLEHNLTTSVNKEIANIRGEIGGGDGPSGWSMKIEFSPIEKTTKVIRYCTYDSSGEKQINQCGTSIK